jgi:cell division protein FtsQ
MAAEPETYQPELLTEEEPKYLRRQKPLEIRRRKLGRRTWKFYGRVLLGILAAAAGGWATYVTWDFFAHSPRVILAHPEQVLLTGNHFVSRQVVLEKFMGDRGKSVARVPLDERRRALQEIPWVEQVSVERVFPNRIRVHITERTPIALVRLGKDLALADSYGVLLDRPAGEVFHFPVVSGLSEGQPLEEREKRMRLFAQFMKEIDLARPGAGDRVSEADVSDVGDLRAVLMGLSAAGNRQTVLVHFGESDFANKYRILVENMPQWQANAGRVESVDLRFARQVVVNPETAGERQTGTRSSKQR